MFNLFAWLWDSASFATGILPNFGTSQLLIFRGSEDSDLTFLSIISSRWSWTSDLFCRLMWQTDPMKLFPCTNCGLVLHFENTRCEHCGYVVGFDSDALQLVSFQAGERVYCANAEVGVCNWLVPQGSDSKFCRACQLNHYIPNLADVQSHQGWRDIEFAKHRLMYSLMRLGLPLVSKAVDEDRGMAFDFIDSDQVVPEDAEATTGHSHGTITIAIDEADPSQREKNRVSMKERYRTLLGHLRHEIGHYYWMYLIKDHPTRHPRFRDVFGDESADYGEALKRHYKEGPAAQWGESYISAYASSHPWEDWAETWSHYLHLTDTMETAHALGVSLDPSVASDRHRISMVADVDPYEPLDFEIFLNQAVALTFAVNSLNRSMGQPDLYPFILNDPVRQKLTFIHELMQEVRGGF